MAPAANPAVAAATHFSVTITETDVDRRGTVATGTITLNAPLATATAGTWSLSAASPPGILPAGQTVASTVQAKGSGKILASQSGNLTILRLLTTDDEPILKIIGPPHGNAIQDHWFHLGQECGVATITPRS